MNNKIPINYEFIKGINFGELDITNEIISKGILDGSLTFAPAYTIDKDGKIKLTEISLVHNREVK